MTQVTSDPRYSVQVSVEENNLVFVRKGTRKEAWCGSYEAWMADGDAPSICKAAADEIHAAFDLDYEDWASDLIAERERALDAQEDPRYIA